MKERKAQDLAVYLLVVALGALEFALSCRAADFVWDAYYYELAKSIVQGTGYGFNFKPQTMVPPGFPILLSLLIVTVGSSYAVLVRSMAVFTTLALIVTYELLRYQQDREVAAVSCLVLGSSPLLFQFSTIGVFSDMPYFFTSMLLLLLLMHVDSAAAQRWKRTVWWLLCGALLLGSILMRSTGTALVGGILGWLAVSFLKEREAAKRRFKIFVPLVIAGIAAQIAWMSWAKKHQFSEWPVHGYQEHYLAQLELKNGNNPELGLATWRDVLVRPVDNADDIAAAMVGLFSRKQTSPAWYSPMTLIPIALLLLGLAHSFWKTGGGLLEWYFVSYEGLFLFWPWNFELRFLLPVAPLAFLYTCRGGIFLWRLARNKALWVGVSGFVIAVAGCASTVACGWSVPKPQARYCVAIWLVVAAISGALWWGGKEGFRQLSLLCERTVSIGGRLVPARQALCYVVVICLFTVGVAMQLRIGVANLHSVPEADPDIEAAIWIKGHTDPSTVLMARKEDLVYHYSQHRVVWFPPSSDAQILMNGIRRNDVKVVVVVDRDYSYWKPSDADSFKVLSKAYPDKFTTIHQGPHYRVFAVSFQSFEGHS